MNDVQYSENEILNKGFINDFNLDECKKVANMLIKKYIPFYNSCIIRLVLAFHMEVYKNQVTDMDQSKEIDYIIKILRRNVFFYALKGGKIMLEIERW